MSDEAKYWKQRALVWKQLAKKNKKNWCWGVAQINRNGGRCSKHQYDHVQERFESDQRLREQMKDWTSEQFMETIFNLEKDVDKLLDEVNSQRSLAWNMRETERKAFISMLDKLLGSWPDDGDDAYDHIVDMIDKLENTNV
jgi:hypothetical protein